MASRQVKGRGRHCLGPVTLTGRFLRLEPLRPAHLDKLTEPARDDRIWTWLPRALQEGRGADGSRRTSVTYSVVESEWPAVKAGLVERLESYSL